MNGNKQVLLELSDSTVRALLLQKKDKQYLVLKAKTFPVQPGAGLLSALNTMFLEFPRENITALFPREKCVFRNLSPKEKTPASLKEAAELEAEEGLPFGKENTALDYCFLKEKQSGLLVSAAFKDIRLYFENLDKVKAFPASVVPTTAALFNVFKNSSVYTKEPSLLVFKGGERADILACREGEILLSRGIELKETDLQAEVKVTLEALAREGKKMTKVFVCGTEFEGSIKLAPSNEFVQKTGLAGNVDEWLLLSGLFTQATEKETLELDLLKYAPGKKGSSPLYVKLLKTAAYAAAALLVISGAVFFLNRMASNELDDIKSELSGLEVQGGKKWSAAVSEIMNAVPNEIVLNEMSGDNKGEISLKGTAKARKDITVFLDSLNKLKGYSSELSFANELVTGSGPVTQFMVKMQARGAAK